jgi:hypothetical protein
MSRHQTYEITINFDLDICDHMLFAKARTCSLRNRNIRVLQCQFWLSTHTLLFYGKACVIENILPNQNCRRRMINKHQPYFSSKGDKALIVHIDLTNLVHDMIQSDFPSAIQ